jgi:protein-disulfide isomerase
MNDKPENEEQKPVPQAEPSAQPEIQSGSGSTPRDGYAPYVPFFEETAKAPQKSAPSSMPRRKLLGWLSVLAIGVALKESHLNVMGQVVGLAGGPPQPFLPITAAPLNPGIALVESPSAKLTIEEFTDFLCPFCARFANYLDLMKEDFGSDVRIVYRSLPRPAHGPLAETSARAFQAAFLQNPAIAYSYYKELLAHQSSFFSVGEPFLYEAAKKFNIDTDRMKSDMTSKTVLDRIDQDKVRAEKSGLILSPSWIIGDRGFNGTPGDFDIMKSIIGGQLN